MVRGAAERHFDPPGAGLDHVARGGRQRQDDENQHCAAEQLEQKKPAHEATERGVAERAWIAGWNWHFLSIDGVVPGRAIDKPGCCRNRSPAASARPIYQRSSNRRTSDCLSAPGPGCGSTRLRLWPG